uniref:Protein kinase domain-containing protein n=1 Tax=Cyprinus carpio carpio TaxID=630221 RepID=A0A9J8BQR6_CYPCA
MTGVQPMPCPVLLGTVKGGGLSALLHRYTIEKKVAKVEKVLKKGVEVDSMNHLGQTPLFCASLLGFASVAEKLLQYGANPNHRCNDGSTPVHAAVFSCNPWLLSSLLDAGGDLRLHDDQGRVPKDWAEAGAQENSPKMLAFLKRCESQMQRLLQTHLSRDERTTPTSSKTLLSSPSLLKLLRPRSSGLIHENNTRYKMSACDMMMHCFGYGKLCFEKPGLSLGLAASVLLISDCDLVQANDEPLNSFMCGSFIRMTNYSWKGYRVTVKELHDVILQKCEEHDGLLDLLISEQEYCCQLSHPHLLLLMAVSISADLDSTKLVYERVNLGSLYNVLHQRRDEFPLLPLVDLLSVVLQVCEVLMYLHGRSLVLRALSSHTVLIVHPGVAKVTGLGFIVPSEGTASYAPPPVPLPLGLINWAAPEVIRYRACTGKADLYSVCALLQEIFTDAVPWGSTDPRWIKRSVEASQALIANPAVPEPYYHFLQTGLQHRAQHRTSSLHDLCYNLRCHIREIRSEKTRSGWHSWSVLQSIPGWNTDINQTREQDKSVYQHCSTAIHNEIREHHLKRIYREEDESTSDTNDFHSDISHSDITALHEWPSTHHTSLSEPPCSNYRDTDKDLAISRSISKHTGSIVLNLKVSQVVLKQAEQSLDNVEADQLGAPCFDEVDALMKRVNMEKECNVGVGKAMGPPFDNYISKWTINRDEEVSQYSSAQEESFESTSYPSSVQEEKRDLKRVETTKRGQQQTGRQKSERLYAQLGLSKAQKDSTGRSCLEEHFQTKPSWTSEVREMVALMTGGRLGSPLSAFGSSDSEDVAEQQLYLQDRHSVNSYQESETQESTDLEQLFKSFAGIQSDSEESTNYHTINHTFDETNGVLEEASNTKVDKRSSDDSDCTQTQQSSMFYTPKHHPSICTSSGEERSQSLSSEDELDVTMEVCRPSSSPAEEKQAVENSLSEYRLAQEDSKDSESITPVHRCIPTISCLPDLAEIADLSSISCSPAHHQEWVESAEAPPIPLSRGHPPCNSTPRSPKDCRTHLQYVQVGTEHLQSLLDSSPWGSAPSHTVCTESYATASAGDSSTTNASVSSVLQSPVLINISKDGREKIDSPSSGNAEFTTASCGARQTTETSQGASEEIEHPIKNNDVDEEGEEVGDGPSDSEHQCEQESSDKKVFDDEDIAERMEGCEGENPCQIHNQHPDVNPAAMDSNANLRSHNLEETEIVSQSDIKGEGDVREDLGCPEGDYIETAECKNELGEKIEAADQS